MIRRTSLRCMPFYMAQYMVLCMYQSYFPVYLTSLGIPDGLRGILLALAPLAAVLGQPVWGNAGDRASSKNRLLRLVCLAAGVLMLLLSLPRNPWMLGALFALFAFFYMSVQPMGDAVALERLQAEGLPFGPVRASATISFAALSALSGLFLEGHPERSVPIGGGLLLLTALSTLLLPETAGRRKAGEAGGLKALLGYRTMMTMVVFSGLMMIGMTFFYNAFSVYFTKDLGGSADALGWCYFISSMTELPFLFLSDRIFRRHGIGRLLCLSAAVMTVRWTILGLTHSWIAALLSQMLHCGCFLFMSFSMIQYVDSVVPPQYKTAGQILYTLLTLSAARLAGALIGGVISDAWGNHVLFLCGAVLTFGVFLAILFYSRRHAGELRPLGSAAPPGSEP